LSYYIGIFLFLISDLTTDIHTVKNDLDDDGVGNNFISYFGLD
jgi:hypothetical protein